MKFCQPHWNELRKAIQVRGLEPLVAPNGMAAVYRLKQELEGTQTNPSYDPLMAAHNMISAKVIEMGGLYLLMGDYCPLCELEAHKPADMEDISVATEWIRGCVDSVFEYCKENKFISKSKDTLL